MKMMNDQQGRQRHLHPRLQQRLAQGGLRQERRPAVTGLPGRQRVVDWLTLDLQSYLYPKEDRDNFGMNVGLVSYDLRWHIGDRVTLVSDGHVNPI